jgi:hypothetical protein
MEMLRDHDSPASAMRNYDAVVLGSDQIWNPTAAGEIDSAFLEIT